MGTGVKQKRFSYAFMAETAEMRGLGCELPVDERGFPDLSRHGDLTGPLILGTLQRIEKHLLILSQVVAPFVDVTDHLRYLKEAQDSEQNKVFFGRLRARREIDRLKRRLVKAGIPLKGKFTPNAAAGKK
jgi:hypothetical protein